MTPPTDADLDDMHHALGRPDGPHVKPYRNAYVIGRDTEEAARKRQTTGWREIGTMNAGADSVFKVTEEGVAAVWAWLAAKNKAAGLRLYEVGGDGLERRQVMAKSHAAAKAEVWRDLDGWTWREFLALKPTARLVPRPSTTTGPEIPF